MPSFLIADIRVINREKYNEYRVQFRACVQRHGGRFLARGQEPEVVQGGWQSPRMVLVEFGSFEAAHAMMPSQAYRALEVARANCAMFDIVIVDGLDTSQFSRCKSRPTYALVDARIINRTAFEAYRERMDLAVRANSGRYLAVTEQVHTVAGNWAPTFLAILEFPSRKQAGGTYAMPDHEAVRNLGTNAAMIDVILLSGESPDVPI